MQASMTPSGVRGPVISQEQANVSDVCTAIALMMEAISTSETSVNFYDTTQRNSPDGCHLHTLTYDLNCIT
jgi:hypothetical protein